MQAFLAAFNMAWRLGYCVQFAPGHAAAPLFMRSHIGGEPNRKRLRQLDGCCLSKQALDQYNWWYTP
jgi:hypothetical protein